jgi:hypothetical protein
VPEPPTRRRGVIMKASEMRNNWNLFEDAKGVERKPRDTQPESLSSMFA